MRTSKNQYGQVEAYTDEGQFVGILPPDYPGLDRFAEDGGPGSGNFGHKGRPGLVGGSGPGGGRGSGIKYRGGRSDIGYFGTRKDWLNGLTGEAQHKATRCLANAKKKLNEAKERKAKIEKIEGLLTENEKEEMLKNQGLSDIDGMTPEEYIISHGKKEEKGELVEHMSKARKWEQYKDQYISENLSDDEKKVFEYVDRNFNRLDDTAKNEYFQLKAKAMGVNVTPEISEESLIGAGLKEKPVPPEPTKPEEPNQPEADYQWYDERRKGSYANPEGYMGAIVGESVGYNRGLPVEDFKALNKKFVDAIKYDKKLTPKKLALYGTTAIGGIRSIMSTEKHPSGFWHPGQFEYTEEMLGRLTSDEKKRLLQIVQHYENLLYSGAKPHDNLEMMTTEDYRIVEGVMRTNLPKKNEEKELVRDYILLQEKMLVGETPTSKEEVEKKAEEKKQEEQGAKSEEEKKRQEYLNSEQVKKEREHAKELIEARKKKQHPSQYDTTFAKEMGDRMTNAEVFINNCGNVDAQVAWDICTPNVHVRDTTGGSYYSDSFRAVYLNPKISNGDTIHTPWETLYHEVGHAIDHEMGRKFGYGEKAYFSSMWHNGEFCDTIEKEAKAFIEKVTKGCQEEFEQTDFTDPKNYKLLDKYYKQGSNEYYDVRFGRKPAKWGAARKYQATAWYLDRIPDYSRGTLSDVLQGATRSKVDARAGHDKGYFQGAEARENMATECFAELYAAVVRNPESLKGMREHFPQTVKCFEQMLKEIAERG